MYEFSDFGRNRPKCKVIPESFEVVNTKYLPDDTNLFHVS